VILRGHGRIIERRRSIIKEAFEHAGIQSIIVTHLGTHSGHKAIFFRGIFGVIEIHKVRLGWIKLSKKGGQISPSLPLSRTSSQAGGTKDFPDPSYYLANRILFGDWDIDWTPA
jgi:hypothetical protein